MGRFVVGVDESAGAADALRWASREAKCATPDPPSRHEGREQVAFVSPSASAAWTSAA